MIEPRPRLIHVGNNNYVNASRILTAFTLRTKSAQRALKAAAAAGLLIDFTAALPTKGVLLLDTGVMIRVPLRPMDIQRALEQLDNPSQ